jgi:predicted MFS family arabinose efflux permease
MPTAPAQFRASSFSPFAAGYGICRLAGSAAIGILYDALLSATRAFCVVTQLAAAPLFFILGRRGNAQLTDRPT